MPSDQRQTRFLLIGFAVTLFATQASASSFREVTQGKLILTGTAERLTSLGPTTVSGVLGTGSFRYDPLVFSGDYQGDGLVVEPTGPDRLTISADSNLRRVVKLDVSLLGADFDRSYSGGGSGQFTFAKDFFWQVTNDDGTYPSADSASSGGGPYWVADSGPVSDVSLRQGWRLGNSRETYLELQADGDWFAVSPEGAFAGGGRWEATAVPEPLTIAGSLVACIFAALFWRLAKK